MIKKIKENKYKIISLVLIFISFIFCLMAIYNKEKPKQIEEQKVNDYIEITSIEDKEKSIEKNNNTQIKSEYFLILEIPKINLKKGVYNFDNENNSVEKGIQLIEKSDMPNVKNGNLILASHRGNSDVSYFNDLHKLNKADMVYVYFNGYKYSYKIKNWYKEKKTGHLTIKRDENKNVIALITCVKNEDNQVIYIGELVDQERY